MEVRKLKISDIEILSPGQLAKKAIFENYESIAAFCRAIGMSYKTVSQYLKETKLGSVKFKRRMPEALNTSYGELILTERQQVSRFVDLIFDNIRKYKTAEDYKVMIAVEKLCNDYNMKEEKMKIKRNKAMYYFNKNLVDEAIEKIEEAIEYAKSYYNPNYYYYFKCDLARMYIHKSEYARALYMLNDINIEDMKYKEFKDRTLYRYYYVNATVANRKDWYDISEKMYRKSIRYSRNDIDHGVCLNGIGLSFKKRKIYGKALEYYNMALEKQPSKEKHVVVYNNIAELYRVQEEYITATYYIRRAINLIEEGHVEFSFSAYKTYLEIKVCQKKEKEAFTRLMEWINQGNNSLVSKQNIIDGYITIVETAKEIKNIEVLEEAEKHVKQLIEEESFQEHIKGLHEVVGKISLAFDEIKKRRKEKCR